MGGILRGLGIGNTLGGGLLGAARGLGGVGKGGGSIAEGSPFMSGLVGQMLAKRAGDTAGKKKRKPRPGGPFGPAGPTGAGY